MTNVIFSGSLSAQAVSGETITIVVTKPDSTSETLTTQTLADKSYTVSKVYNIAGNYGAQAKVSADAVYMPWQSNVVAFAIGLTTRTGTLIVTLA